MANANSPKQRTLFDANVDTVTDGVLRASKVPYPDLVFALAEANQSPETSGVFDENELAVFCHVLEDECQYYLARGKVFGPLSFRVREGLDWTECRVVDECATIPTWVEEDGLEFLSCECACDTGDRVRCYL